MGVNEKKSKLKIIPAKQFLEVLDKTVFTTDSGLIEQFFDQTYKKAVDLAKTNFKQEDY